jgi:hypothetical protein
MPGRDEERHYNRHSGLRYCDSVKQWFTQREWDKRGTRCAVHGHHGQPHYRGLSPEDEAKFRRLAAAFETPGQPAPAIAPVETKPVPETPLAVQQQKVMQTFLDEARQQQQAMARWLEWQEKLLERSEALLEKPLPAPRALIEWYKGSLREMEERIRELETTSRAND